MILLNLELMDERLLKLELNQGVRSFDVDVTAGRKTVEIELFNQGEVPGPFRPLLEETQQLLLRELITMELEEQESLSPGMITQWVSLPN